MALSQCCGNDMNQEQSSITVCKKQLPSVCVGMISFNDAHLIKGALDSIFSQDYPTDKLSVLVVDGGSTDGTLDIARSTRAQVICRPDLKDKPYLRGDMLWSIPDADILFSFSADNRFMERNALKNMVRPFDDPEIAGVGTFRYGWRQGDPALCRYFALIGGGDTIAVALGTADRSPYDVNGWTLRGTARDCGTYFKLTFAEDSSSMPTVGFNGFAYRKKHLDAVGGVKFGLLMEASLELVRAGYKFAMVKNAHVVHLLADNLVSFVRRRVHWARVYSADNLPRTYHVFDPKRDKLKILLITLGFLTIIPALIRSFKGYLRFRDPAWFLHPLVGLVFVCSYGIMVLRRCADNLLRVRKEVK